MTFLKIFAKIKGIKAPESLIDSNEVRLKEFQGVINKRLEKNAYLLGDKMSICDLILAEHFSNCLVLKYDWENETPHLWKYYEKIKAEVPKIEENRQKVVAFTEKVKAELNL